MHMVGYTDPGIVSNLGQVAYIAVLGAVSFIIVRPWRFIRSLFSPRFRTTEEQPSRENDLPA